MAQQQQPAGDPLTFLLKVGRGEADKIAKKAKLDPRYFNQVCYGHRRASVDAAERLVEASKGSKAPMTLLGILQHEVKRRRGKVVVAVV